SLGASEPTGYWSLGEPILRSLRLTGGGRQFASSIKSAGEPIPGAHFIGRSRTDTDAELLSRLVGVEFVLIRELFVLEELVFLGQEFHKRRSFAEANRPLISVREGQQRALVVSAACHQLRSRRDEAVFVLEPLGECQSRKPGEICVEDQLVAEID